MPAIAVEFAALLNAVDRPGDFYTSGACEIFAPGLTIDGVGQIALPLLSAQAEQLIAAAERAPYGRGDQTLLDTAIRRTWQINADRIHIQGRSWERSLETIVARVAEGLGVSDPVTAELYKLLVYDVGSFFVSHRDSEKTPGMFATLTIVFPGLHTGGDLVIRHAGREVRLDLQCTEPSEVAYAAFYADCVHEVLPIESGCRLTLVYNLSRQGTGRQPRPPNYETEQGRLVTLLRQWGENAKRADDHVPDKLIYPLEHAYTAESLSFAALKGADAAKAATLIAAAKTGDCDLHLALVSIEESGSADYDGDYRRYRHDDAEFEAGEVDDRSETLCHWHRPEGPAGLGILPILDNEVSPPDALEDLVPDEESFQEATGNAGATFERSYRVAALVLWPNCRRIAVINQGGLSATLPYLTDLADRWTQSGADRSAPLWREAHELTGHMLTSWPRHGWWAFRPPPEGGKMLAQLDRLGDTIRIDAFLTEISAEGVFGEGDAEGVVQAIRQLPPARAAVLLAKIITGNGAAIDTCADLLALAATAALGEFDLKPAAAALVAALPGDPSRKTGEASRRAPTMAPRILIDTLTALNRIDPGLADAAAGIFLAWPRVYALDAVLVPAAVALAGSAGTAASERLRAACVEHLRTRIAEPLAPPADWTRPATLTCKCPYCTELGTFLADAVRSVWNFKSLQANRYHVESTIQNSRCDLDTDTIRRGSPHVLVCTKNQAGYERKVGQRKMDQENLAHLENHRT
jgi:hypothetical protein